MIEITAILRRDRAAQAKEELARIGCQGYSQFPVLGRGRQRGLRGPGAGDAMPFLPKILFNLVVEDEKRDETIEAILRAGQTGQYGDGKIFVLDVGEAYRISGEEKR